MIFHLLIFFAAFHLDPGMPGRDMASADEKYQESQQLHVVWDALLSEFVSPDGRVNYSGLKAREASLDRYLRQLSGTSPETLPSPDDQKAFWINAYNAFTVKLLLEHFPVTSIRDIGNGNPWDIVWIPLAGKELSLNMIEHDLIGSQYQDPRVHFAVNCAARSCPPLLNAAFTGPTLDEQLERQARAFINDDTYNTINARQVSVSKIFEWYAEDFGDLIVFLNRYSKTAIRPDAKVSYHAYDWTLNGE